MSMAVLLLPADDGDVAWGTGTVGELSALGISHVAMLRDDRTVAIVLEGWAFDPMRSARHALRILGRADCADRVLLPLARAALEVGDGLGRGRPPATAGRRRSRGVALPGPGAENYAGAPGGHVQGPAP